MKGYFRSFPCVPADDQDFIASEKIFVGAEVAGIKISFLGKNYQTWFGNKVEGAFAGSVLTVCGSSQSSTSESVLQELGGEEMAETTLREAYHLMKSRQKSEQKGLLTNCLANRFCVPDVNGVLRMVSLLMFDGTWNFDAFPIESLSPWPAGCRIFYHRHDG